jgi:uncharacterized hydrophobic protein (TIGR00271 family)
VRKTAPRLLLTAPFALPAVEGRAQTSDELVRAAPCQSFATLFGTTEPSGIKRILLVLSGGVHDRAAVRLVDGLRQHLSAEVTIAYVEDETGATPGRFGQDAIRSMLHDTSLDEDAYLTKVVVDRLKHRGIIELYEGQDLVVAAWDFASYVRPLRQSLDRATVAVVKRMPPLRRDSLIAGMPRINPSDLADLILTLRLGSRWSADFIGMLGLAAMIASLGLLQDSPAVVIGSMLLAPLMTPMIGLGLALCQASPNLARTSGRSILRGFLLTLAISLLIGFVTPAGETLTNEVLARGGPNVLDLLIAVAAAAAATFSMARPNISGTLAGVAIATALVPPVCSAGIALAHGEPGVGFGAVLLFFTNLIAIIVTSSLTFSLLGVTSMRALARHRKFARGVLVGLVVLLIALSGPLSHALLEQLREGKNVAAARPVTQEMRDALFDHVAQDEGVEIMLLARPRAKNQVLIHLASTRELPVAYAEELRRVVHETTDESDIEVVVVAVRGMWRSDANVSESGGP